MKSAIVTIVGIVLSSLALASPILANDGDFERALESARGEAILDHPAVSLVRYRDALSASAGDPTRARIAHFGIARMLSWLGRFAEAHEEYTGLLATPLSSEDRDVALDGNVRSLLALGRPIAAYRLVRANRSPSGARLALVAARAATDVGRPVEARNILARYRDELEALRMGSRLQREALRLAEDVRQDAGVSARMTHVYAHDTDAEIAIETTLDVRQPLPSGAVVTYRARRLELGGNAGLGTVASIIGAGVVTRPSDALEFSASGDIGHYRGWNPFFAAASVAYQPQDSLRLRAYGEESAIETQLGLTNHERAATFGLGVSVRPSTMVTLDASSYERYFSDGNRRFGYFASATSQVPSVRGFTLGLRGRGFVDLISRATGYFNPSHFSEQSLLGTERFRSAGWNASVTAGIGREKIATDSASLTTVFGFDVRGPAGGCLRVEVSADKTNSALGSESGYRRTSASLALACTI